MNRRELPADRQEGSDDLWGEVEKAEGKLGKLLIATIQEEVELGSGDPKNREQRIANIRNLIYEIAQAADSVMKANKNLREKLKSHEGA